MGAHWKKKLKPGIVLRKIDSVKTVFEDGRVSYSGFEYHDAIATLQSMVEFPRGTEGLDKEGIVARAVSRVAKSHGLAEALVLEEINTLIREALSNDEGIYFVLASVSLKKPYPGQTISCEGASIRILADDFPSKYTGREDAFLGRYSSDDATPKGYARVIVRLKAKSERSAASMAMRALDIQRAIWCLFGNSSMELMGSGPSTPINKIRLGGAHTVHAEDGSIASDSFWYEPNYTYAKPFTHSKHEVIVKNVSWFNERMSELPYGEVVKAALLRYVRALDEKDQNVALIRLWGALEELASPGNANYELVVRRVSFLFEEREYHEQVLEHLRDYRNRNVHSGDQDERARTSCYQLQNYFYRFVMFHLKNVGKFQSLEEANSFLDLPASVEILARRKELIEMAIKFREPVG